MRGEHTTARLAGLALALVLLVGAAGVGWARTATPPPPGQRIYDMKWMNINKWLCPFYNDGRYALDVTIGTGEAGASWPQPMSNKYIFGAGLWFGSIKPRDDGGEDTLVSFGYNPNSGGTEMTPTDAAHVEEGAGSPDDRVYVFPGDWPPPQERFGTDTAPDGSYLVPQEAFSLQDMWCTYCDLGEDNHIAPGYPQEVEVFQTVYAWNYPTNQDIFFIIYQVRNAGDDMLKGCYMGALMDPDIGVHDDDMVGLLLNTLVPGEPDTVKNVGYAGDVDNTEVPNSRGQWEDGTPGVVAYKFLESPLAPNGQQLGMTAFKKFTIDIDPVTDPAQYLTMAGYDYRTGVKTPYDSVDVAEADKRFVQCSGPFDLPPGRVEKLIVATIAAPFGGEGQDWANRPIDSLVHLAQVANQAQFIYDQGWLLPGPPVSPNITLVPGDNTVRIVWDDLPIRTPDSYWERVASQPGPGYDPMYQGYDFQGYVVYKSADGAEWEILTQCDIADSVPDDTVPYRYPPGADSSLSDSMWIEMDNTGLSYSVEDDEVVNGFEYFYCVTAYDWNYVTTVWDTTQVPPVPVEWDTLILRSGIVSNYSTVPRWDAANWVDATIDVVTVAGDTTNNGLEIDPQVVVPFDVMTGSYGLYFLGPEYVARDAARHTYYVVDESDNSIVIDTSQFEYTVGEEVSFSLPVFNGQELALTLSYDEPESRFDTIYVETGSYSGGLQPTGISSGDQASLWAFRGSDYRIEWGIMPGSGELTAHVYDVTNGGIEVPYNPFLTNQPAEANGWCFTDFIGRNPNDTLKADHALFYICGGYFALNYDEEATPPNQPVLLNEIQDGDVWQAVGYKLDGTAPYYNQYQLVATPGYASDEELEDGLNIKVVPNPYIVFNSWESSSDERMVKFTHLPHECTIRIFTLAGDLVKVIDHVHDGDPEEEGQPHQYGGTEGWDFLNDNQQLVAAGVYVFHVESEVGEFTGKLVFIH